MPSPVPFFATGMLSRLLPETIGLKWLSPWACENIGTHVKCFVPLEAPVGTGRLLISQWPG